MGSETIDGLAIVAARPIATAGEERTQVYRLTVLGMTKPNLRVRMETRYFVLTKDGQRIVGKVKGVANRTKTMWDRFVSEDWPKVTLRRPGWQTPVPHGMVIDNVGFCHRIEDDDVTTVQLTIRYVEMYNGVQYRTIRAARVKKGEWLWLDKNDGDSRIPGLLARCRPLVPVETAAESSADILPEDEAALALLAC